jgi:hypothetical protein
MLAVKAYYNGNVFVPLVPVNTKQNQSAIITILDDIEPNVADNSFKKFIGKLSRESCEEITKALMETQRIDHNEW